MNKILIFLLFLMVSTKIQAIQFQELTSNSKIKFWFVEDNSIPVISMSFTFSGGAYFDKIGKEGTSNFVAALLDEGAGDIESIKFKKKMKSLGMKLSFSSSKDSFSGSFQTISDNLEESSKLLSLVLSSPSFNVLEIEKVRNQILASLKFEESNIQRLASKKFDKDFFEGHSFNRNVDGNLDSVKQINRDDLFFYFKNFLTQANLKIGISGNINNKDVIKLVDNSFGKLPANLTKSLEISEINELPVGLSKSKKKTPQSAVVFGQKGLKRDDSKFFHARILNYVLGGGGFQSKLYKSIREEKGLVYSIYSYLIPYSNNGFILGGFQTKNDQVDDVINLVKENWRLIGKEGITQKELDDAKSYYIGSFSRNYTSTGSIASLLNTIQIYDLGNKYFTDRTKIIEGISLNEVNYVAKELFKSEDLYFSVVGE